ncbi:putative GST-like protein YibF [Tritonibacter multivorans]|uniref:Putative GST-like protein YibF n=1 Tax=Tritonibacter multivorans TaxID=928856 RepID=A0A0P1GD72_9RHOB|nr:glutathione S-transferase [Tritonibacter multivorans]MDA7419964.1 glutathione S-transferase [Tritonibacter multivorans]CUH79413.1 putative GST-like protein YibF [Tritonibacter multivorans]SFC10112.1 Glutathione S-transferase [Tritonibacter multivorans]
MKLYHSPTSPFVRKVMLVLHETNQLDTVEILNVSTTVIAPDTALAAANPLKKIPALERDSGPTLYDSRVICEYLDDRAGAGLYAGGWDMKVLEATAEGLMDSAVSMAYERNLRPAEKQWEAWVAGHQGKVLSACSAVESRWMPMLNGPLNIGQIAMGAALSYLDFRHGKCGWRNGNPALTAWFEAFSERPSMVATALPQPD